MKKLALCVFLLTASVLFGQNINSPQYLVNLNFLTGGIYGSTTAVNTVFQDQLTANSKLEGDLLVAPSGGVTDYMVGGNYNLCGISAIDSLLATTSLSCDKFEPFAAGAAGLGRVQQGSAPSLQAAAYLFKLGAGYDLTGSGNYGLEFVGGYGRFGPSITGQSNSGFVFYSGITFGGGSNAAATAAKQARFQLSQAKKQAKLVRKLKKQQEELQKARN